MESSKSRQGIALLLAALMSTLILFEVFYQQLAADDKSRVTVINRIIFINGNSNQPSQIADSSSPLLVIQPNPAAVPNVDPDGCDGCVISTAVIQGTLDASAEYTRMRYRFENVHLRSNNTLSVFLAKSVPLPSQEHYVDPVHNNATDPNLPTVISYQKLLPSTSVSFRVDYSHASMTVPFKSQPDCIRWEERPVFLMHVPLAHNVWHVWNDALLSAYQTLREEGLLPLAKIDEEGNMEEYTSDFDLEGCQWVIEPEGDGSAYRELHCAPKTGLVAPSKCTPGIDSWCRPGVVAVNRTNGPILMLAKGSNMPEEHWMHMFRAVSEDIRDWDSMIGTCFRQLYIGKSNTVNFYTVIRKDDIPGEPIATDLRRRAMETFTELMSTAQVEHHAQRQASNITAWTGYNNTGLERLRQGIGPEEIEALDVLRNMRTESILVERLTDKDLAEVDRLRKEEHATMRTLVEQKFKEEEYEALKADRKRQIWKKRRSIRRSIRRIKRMIPTFLNSIFHSSSNESEDYKRPVVTFMLRSAFKRCVANEADILEYILSRYNVTVRVTTFEEPLYHTMELLTSTDLLIGMHGAGWTNAIFLKSRAWALQLYPYGWWLEASQRPIRGGMYKTIVRSKGGFYREWMNQNPEYGLVRPWDFEALALQHKSPPYDYSLHPQKYWERPEDGRLASYWINQSTLVNITDIAPMIEEVMGKLGLEPMQRQTIANDNSSSSSSSSVAANNYTP